MPYSINLPARVRFPVEGTFTDETGRRQPFKFWLLADRLATSDDVRAQEDAAKTAEAAGSTTPITDVLLPRLHDWSDVVDADNAEVPFTSDACRGMLNQSGVAALVHHALVFHSGARG